MSNNDEPRSFTPEQLREFFARCQTTFARLDRVLAANTPVCCVMVSLIGFASESAAPAAMPREHFLDASAGRLRRRVEVD
jgi:hypothetical protein